MTKPKLLDLFCCQGGASKGYVDAGFDVIGVDKHDQPNYPYKFYRGDAIEFVNRHAEDFQVIHASPPCQHFTKYKNRRKDLHLKYDDLILETRQALQAAQKYYIIENVPGAPLLNPILLCGSMFDLDVRRHRLFELNFDLNVPICDHSVWEPNRFPGGRSIERGGARVLCRATVEIGRWNIPLATQQSAIGIDWISDLRALSEAIPPAYTKYIGKHLIKLVNQS